MTEERTYVVQGPVLINGKTRVKGDEVTHTEIMGREPYRLGSLLRLGHIIEKPAKEDKPKEDKPPKADKPPKEDKPPKADKPKPTTRKGKAGTNG
jgi:hypothetical protein